MRTILLTVEYREAVSQDLLLPLAIWIFFIFPSHSRVTVTNYLNYRNFLANINLIWIFNRLG